MTLPAYVVKGKKQLASLLVGKITSVALPAGASQHSTFSIKSGLTATGTTRTDALALVADMNYFTTVGSGAGCVLPAGIPGRRMLIINNGANVLKIYATGSETIDATAGATGVSLSAYATTRGIILYCVAATVWFSEKFGAASS